MPEIWTTIFRTFLAFGLLIIVAQLAGWNRLNRLSFLDMALATSVGGVAALLAAAGNLKIWPLVAALIVLGGLVYAYDKIHLAGEPLRKLLPNIPWGDENQPHTHPEGLQELIVDGEFIADRRLEEWLAQSLQERGIRTVDEVNYAVIGSNGKLFVDKRELL